MAEEYQSILVWARANVAERIPRGTLAEYVNELVTTLLNCPDLAALLLEAYHAPGAPLNPMAASLIQLTRRFLGATRGTHIGGGGWDAEAVCFTVLAAVTASEALHTGPWDRLIMIRSETVERMLAPTMRALFTPPRPDRVA